MITESFINSCYSLLLNKNNTVRKTNTTYRDIFEILSIYEKNNKGNIPIIFKNKFEALRKFCIMKIENKSDESAIDSILTSPKYASLEDFIYSSMEKKIHDLDFISIINQVRLRKRFNLIYSNYQEISKLLDQYREGSYETLDDIVALHEGTIRHLYANVMETNRLVEIEAAATLDLVRDNYDRAVIEALKKYDSRNAIPTGYAILDKILNGGLQPSRLYTIAGTSGSGKSTLVSNFIINAATKKYLKLDDTKEEDEKEIENVFLYITLENTVEEALLKFYQILFQKTIYQALNDFTIKGPNEIKKSVMSFLKRNNSTIVIKYFPARTISPLDLIPVIDSVIEYYGKKALKSVTVDYIDLLESDLKFDRQDLMVGYMVTQLKTFAVFYSIPMVTPTQLNRSGYNSDKSSKFKLDQIGESMKKIDNSDFVALMGSDETNENIVHFKIGKNRTGTKNMNLQFKVDLPTARFISCFKENMKTGSVVDYIDDEI